MKRDNYVRKSHEGCVGRISLKQSYFEREEKRLETNWKQSKMQGCSRRKRVKYSGKLRKWKIPGSVNLLIPSSFAKYINHSM